MSVHAVTGAAGHLGRFAIQELLSEPRRARVEHHSHRAHDRENRSPCSAWHTGARSRLYTRESLGAAARGCRAASARFE
jgi:hypothetical protein